MSGKKIALIAIPAVIVIAIAAVFAVPALQKPSNGTPIVPASNQDCTAISPKVRTILVSIDGQNDETKTSAANTLVEQYCQRLQLVQEIGAMAYPGAGLVAYACDGASGRIGDSAFQNSLGSNTQIYCDGAFISIFEESENMLVNTEGYLDDLRQELENDDPEDNGNFTSTVNFEEAQAKVDEISEFARQAKSQLRSQQYFEAAKSMDRAAKLLDQLGQN